MNPGDLAFICQLPEADATEIEVTHVAASSPTFPTAPNDTRAKRRVTSRA